MSGTEAWHDCRYARRTGDPILKFSRWLDDARRLRIPNYETVALATATSGGKASVRFVLPKGIDQRGFVFFTDARGREGREPLANPRAALTFYWQPAVNAERPGQSEIGGIFQCGGGRRGRHYGA